MTVRPDHRFVKSTPAFFVPPAFRSILLVVTDLPFPGGYLCVICGSPALVASPVWWRPDGDPAHVWCEDWPSRPYPYLTEIAEARRLLEGRRSPSLTRSLAVLERCARGWPERGPERVLSAMRHAAWVREIMTGEAAR